MFAPATKIDGSLEHGEHQVLLHLREKAANHRFDFRARQRNGIRLRQRLLAEPGSQSSDFANERVAKIVVGTFFALQEATGPG